MNKTDNELYKQELIKRYKYIYLNAIHILAPYMIKENDDEVKQRMKKFKTLENSEILNKHFITLELNEEILLELEDFILSDGIMDQSKFYKKLEELKNNKEYLEKVKKGCLLLEEKNKDVLDILKFNLDIWNLLSNVRKFILNQSSDLKNKQLKLDVLDKYFNLSRYSNDGKIWTSGYELNFKDLDNYTSLSMVCNRQEIKPTRDKKDVGVKNNNFINVTSKLSLTEEEKQNIYLSLHDELPWNLQVECKLEEDCLNLLVETRLERPNETHPCFNSFEVKEEEIFVDFKDQVYRYYQLCPKCGYIVNVNKELLSKGIRKRIEERCKMDSNLFRKMYLYSELKCLDNMSKDNQKRLLKK